MTKESWILEVHEIIAHRIGCGLAWDVSKLLRRGYLLAEALATYGFCLMDLAGAK